MDHSKEIDAVRQLAPQIQGLRLLVLHGSRARGDDHGRSDWDFAYLGDDTADDLDIRYHLVGALRRDDIDLANLSRAGGLLRYLAARDGLLIFEKEPGLFDQFRCDAASFWFDVEHIVRAEHKAILDSLG